MVMRWGYLNPLGKGTRFHSSSPLDMDRVTTKYMKVGYKDEHGKIRPRSAPLPCVCTFDTKYSNFSLATFVEKDVTKIIFLIKSKIVSITLQQRSDTLSKKKQKKKRSDTYIFCYNDINLYLFFFKINYIHSFKLIEHIDTNTIQI